MAVLNVVKYYGSHNLKCAKEDKLTEGLHVTRIIGQKQEDPEPIGFTMVDEHAYDPNNPKKRQTYSRVPVLILRLWNQLAMREQEREECLRIQKLHTKLSYRLKLRLWKGCRMAKSVVCPLINPLTYLRLSVVIWKNVATTWKKCLKPLKKV